MKISLNWLRDYVDFDWSPAELAEKLTMAGIEVEGVQTRGAQFEHVVVCEIKASARHPNADRLSVCQVTLDGQTTRQIVCGAKNFKVGDRVPVALPGAELPGGFVIKESKLRGELSQGMMCSAKELGLAEDAEGLLILPADTPLGLKIGDVFPPDTVFELEITPNRPDLLSHFGIARELVALGARHLRLPEASVEIAETGPALPLDNRSEELCPLYIGRRVSGVKVGPSPDWIRRRLESIGVRCINNVVDITNFVLHELGHPLHTFDAARLKGETIVIRPAKAGEKILALDGKEYVLTEGRLVIADQNGPIALAGIMGGEHSGVTADTLDLVLESAFFAPSHIRRNSRELGLSSDSSYRFERGVDWGGVDFANRRASHLLARHASGKVHAESRHQSSSLKAGEAISLRLDRINRVLGTALDLDRVERILIGLHLEVRRDAQPGVLLVSPPTFRGDLRREIDLIEEVVRIVGLDQVPSLCPVTLRSPSLADLGWDNVAAVKAVLRAQGSNEILTHKLVDERLETLNQKVSRTGSIRLLNPISADHSHLRSSLLGNMLRTLRLNHAQKNERISLFEAGKVFIELEGKLHERLHLCLGVSGVRTPRDWKNATAADYDFQHVQALVREVCTLVPGSDVTFEKETLAPNQETVLAMAAEARLNGQRLGLVAIPARTVLKEFDLPETTFVAELDLSPLLTRVPEDIKASPLPRFPAVQRDAALIVDAHTTHADIQAAVDKFRDKLLEKIELFDIFKDDSGQKLPAGRKSMAYSFTYRSLETTLTDKEVNDVHDALKKKVAQAVNATLRE